MTELEFIQQARWFAERRGYKASWAYVAFRTKYGKWPGSLLKEGEPQQASQEFVDWVLESWRSAKPESANNQISARGPFPLPRVAPTRGGRDGL